MISSKLKALSLLMTVAALAACSPESKRKNDPQVGDVLNYERSKNTNFCVDTPSVISSSIASYNGYGMPKSKLFNFRLCVKDINGSSLLEGTKFRIKDQANGSLLLTVPMDSCLYWSETHEYSILSDETFYKVVRTVVAEPPYRGSVEVKFAFNPWADGGSAVRDLLKTQLGPNETLIDVGPISMNGGRVFAQQSKPQLSLNVDSLNFEFKGLDYDNYEINNLLGLTVAHRYLIRIKPVALRKTMNKVVQPESFIGGKMKAYFALFKENKDPAVQYSQDNLVFATEFELADDQRVGSFFTDNLVVKFDKIADMTSRTAALLTLIPVDGDATLGELSFSGVMKPGRLSSLSLVPSKVSARDFFDQDRLRRQAPFKAIEAYAQHTKAKQLDLAPVKISKWIGSKTYDPKADVQALLAGRKAANKNDLMAALCTKLYADDPVWLRPCLNRPDYHLNLELRDFVDEVLGAPRIAGLTTTHRLSMNVSYSVSESQGSSSGMSSSMRSGLGVDAGGILTGLGGLIGAVVGGPAGAAGGVAIGSSIAKVLNEVGFKFSIGNDYFATTEVRSSANNSASATVSSGVDITAEGNTFQFDVNAKKCLIVTTKNHDVQNISREEKTPRAAYLCANEATKQTRTETYYLLGQNLGNNGSPFSDSDAANSTNWRMMIRGKQNALLLFDFLQKADLDLVVGKVPSTDVGSPLAKEFNTIQDFPGVLSAK
ncbi:MAG TPA: hypothetical protein PL182_09660 [Pseudobdellovibrionaceae bacterium]|nr:hypothetical protein [Pseudobdellovibrionaceae bacterium]